MSKSDPHTIVLVHGGFVNSSAGQDLYERLGEGQARHISPSPDPTEPLEGDARDENHPRRAAEPGEVLIQPISHGGGRRSPRRVPIQTLLRS